MPVSQTACDTSLYVHDASKFPWVSGVNDIGGERCLEVLEVYCFILLRNTGRWSSAHALLSRRRHGSVGIPTTTPTFLLNTPC